MTRTKTKTEDILELFGKFSERMFPHWDITYLELQTDGSGAICYQWRDHPYQDPCEIEFHSIEELRALLGG